MACSAIDADAHHQAVRREPGADPEQVERGMAGSVSTPSSTALVMTTPCSGLQAGVEVRACTRPRERPRSRRSVARNRFQPGLAREIAPDLPPQAGARDRERRREAEVGILVRSRSWRGAAGGRGGTGGGRSRSDTRTSQLPTQSFSAPVAEERAMRGLVHDDGDAELAGADDEERRHDRERIRPPGDQRERLRRPAPSWWRWTASSADRRASGIPDLVLRQRRAPDGCLGCSHGHPAARYASAAAASSRLRSVVAQSMQASVIETP